MNLSVKDLWSEVVKTFRFFSGATSRDVRKMYEMFDRVQGISAEDARSITVSLIGNYLECRPSVDKSSMTAMLHDSVQEFFALYPEMTASDGSFTLSLALLDDVHEPETGKKRNLIRIGSMEMAILVVRPHKDTVLVFDEYDGLRWSRELRFPTIWHVPVCFAMQSGKVP